MVWSLKCVLVFLVILCFVLVFDVEFVDCLIEIGKRIRDNEGI